MAAYATLPLSPDAIAQKTIEQLVAKVDVGKQENERQLQINQLVALQGELSQLIIDQGKYIRALDSRVDDLKRIISCFAYALGAQPKIDPIRMQDCMRAVAEKHWLMAELPAAGAANAHRPLPGKAKLSLVGAAVIASSEKIKVDDAKPGDSRRKVPAEFLIALAEFGNGASGL